MFPERREEKFRGQSTCGKGSKKVKIGYGKVGSGKGDSRNGSGEKELV